MKLERVCARSNNAGNFCGRKLVEHGPEKQLLCTKHGAAMSFFRAPDTGKPVERSCWALFDTAGRRPAALVIGDITLWEEGYEEQRGDEKVRRGRLMDLFVGEEFLLDGRGGTVIEQRLYQSRSKGDRRVPQTTVIMDAPRPLPVGHQGPMRLIGLELELPGDTPVMRIMGVSPFVRPDRAGVGGSKRRPKMDSCGSRAVAQERERAAA